MPLPIPTTSPDPAPGLLCLIVHAASGGVTFDVALLERPLLKRYNPLCAHNACSARLSRPPTQLNVFETLSLAPGLAALGRHHPLCFDLAGPGYPGRRRACGEPGGRRPAARAGPGRSVKHDRLGDQPQ